MEIEWLRESVSTIASVCAVIAMIECTVDDGAAESSLRLVCGAIAASSILRLLGECIQKLS